MQSANTIGYFPIIDLICLRKQSSSSKRLSVVEVNNLEGTSINLFVFGLSIPACLQIQAMDVATKQYYGSHSN